VVYAVMGRNIAEGRGVVSSFYDARAILEKGFPLGDVHLPGQALLLALSFLVNGSTERAAFVPSTIGFVASGLVLFLSGARTFGRSAGVLAALLLYSFPSVLGYSHSAMVELPLLLCSTLYLAAWLRALETEHWSSGLLLAVVLALGCMLRETFFVLLPSALYPLLRPSAPGRGRALAAFGLTFVAFLGFVFWPMHRNLAPYPHFLSAVLDRDGPGEVALALWENVKHNLAPVSLARRDLGAWIFRLEYLAVFLLPLLTLRTSPVHRTVGLYAATSFALTFALLVAVYPVRSWAAVRAFLFTLPAGLLLVSDLLLRLSRPAVRRVAVGLTLLGLLGFSFAAHRTLVADRVAAQDADHRLSRLITEQTGALRPRAVIADKAFLYGWDAYPVTVIWRASATPREIAALSAILPVDVVVANRVTRDALLAAVRQGAVRDYRLWSQPADDIAFLVSAERIGAGPSEAGRQP
jgi:4-amino-4-deoxy-L-arabinose transferase-like glycosyltransferase